MGKTWEEVFATEDYHSLLHPTGFAKDVCEAFLGLFRGDETRMLEVGSGSGRICLSVARDYPNVDVVGLDLSIELVRRATLAARDQGLRNASFLSADLFEMPFRDGQFSIVLSEGVIEHFPNWEEAAREHVRVCAPGGTVAISVPNWWNLPHTLYKWAYRRRHGIDCEYGLEKSFRHWELSRLAQDLGLEGIRVSGFAPMHGINRLQGRRWWLRGARFVRPAAQALHVLSGGLFSDVFGYEIMVVGRKPSD